MTDEHDAIDDDDTFEDDDTIDDDTIDDDTIEPQDVRRGAASPLVPRTPREWSLVAVAAVVLIGAGWVLRGCTDDDTTARTAPESTVAVATTDSPSTTEAGEPAATVPPTSAPSTTTAAAGAEAPVVVTDPAVDGVFWSETFDADDSLDRLLIEVHNQVGTPDEPLPPGGENGNPPVEFNGDHNHQCQGPDTVRPLVEDHTAATHVWWCAPKGPESGHFMTGVNSRGYVVVAFTPSDDGAPLAFPDEANRVCWDQNLTNLGGRKWTQLSVVSQARYEANDTIVFINPDNEGNAGNSPVAADDDFMFSSQFNAVFYFAGDTRTVEDYDSVDISITDKATRYETCVTDNGDGTITRTQARPGGSTDVFTGPGAFPAGPRLFILSDDSYNPDKFDVDKPDESPQHFGIADPYTWHWDNIVISSAT